MGTTLRALDGRPYCETATDALTEHGVDDERGVTMAESASALDYVEPTPADA